MACKNSYVCERVRDTDEKKEHNAIYVEEFRIEEKTKEN